MQETLKLVIGIGVLLLGFPIGMFLAKKTKEELKSGRKWFRLIILLGFIGAVVSLIVGNDALLFGFLFILVVTSMSLKKKITAK